MTYLLGKSSSRYASLYFSPESTSAWYKALSAKVFFKIILNDILVGIADKGNVICFDFVEVAPQYDPTGATARIAAMTMLNFMGHIIKNKPRYEYI